MSVYETSITNPKKQLEFYKQLSEQLQQENEKLKKKLDKYESPEDMTLMYMWCTEKVKDENKKLKQKQKEFVNYLEDDLKIIYRDCGHRHKIYEEILAKYKEIIGDIENE